MGVFVLTFTAYRPNAVRYMSGGGGALPYKPIRDVCAVFQGIIFQPKFLNRV